MERKFLKKIIFILLLLGAVIVIHISGVTKFFTDIKRLQTWLNSFGGVSYLIYILLYCSVAVFMLPASVFTVVAGLTFGSITGGILALIGATIGATISFLISKYVARDSIKNRFHDNIIFKKIEKGVKENGVSFLILTRLVPIFPYNIQNYAYGLTSIKTLTFCLTSLITMAPGSFIYAYLAGEIVTNGVSLKLLFQFAIAGIILFLISLIPKYLMKKKGIKLD